MDRDQILGRIKISMIVLKFHGSRTYSKKYKNKSLLTLAERRF